MNAWLRVFGLIFCGVLAANIHPAFAKSRAFAAEGGAAVFKSICQGCHMPDAKGAVGAGAYPALAANPNLEAAGYPLMMVVGGRKAMPAFGNMLTDSQIADVVNYVRTNFGNRYTDAVTPEDVAQIREALRNP